MAEFQPYLRHTESRSIRIIAKLGLWDIPCNSLVNKNVLVQNQNFRRLSWQELVQGIVNKRNGLAPIFDNLYIRLEPLVSPHGDNPTPKALLPILNKPLVSYVLSWLEEAEIKGRFIPFTWICLT